MNHLTKYIPKDLAKKLYGHYPYKPVAIGHYDGRPFWDEKEQDEEGWSECNRYYIPTFAEVFDWLMEVKGIDIEIAPDFMNLIECGIRTGLYTFTIFPPNMFKEEDIRITLIPMGWEEGAIWSINNALEIIEKNNSKTVAQSK